jgi:hypothetical protein
MRPLDPFVFLGALAVILAGFAYGLSGGSGNTVRITTPYDEYSYPLSKNRVLEVRGSLGAMKLEIRNGKARVLESGCPGQVCIKRGWIFRIGDSAVCVPNRVIMKIESEKRELDGITE